MSVSCWRAELLGFSFTGGKRVNDRRYFGAGMKLLTQPLVMTSQEDY